MTVFEVRCVDFDDEDRPLRFSFEVADYWDVLPGRLENCTYIGEAGALEVQRFAWEHGLHSYAWNPESLEVQDCGTTPSFPATPDAGMILQICLT